jgi:glycosyltransferase involved in cell wall biosynthesis
MPSPLLVLTNFARFPLRWQTGSGTSGESRILSSAEEFLNAAASNPEAVLLINCDPALTLGLARRLFFQKKPRLVAVDLVLRRPRSLRARLLNLWKRLLLRRVDHFIHYFNDLSGYQKLFGIGPVRSSFVPFKANLFDRSVNKESAAGEYVLCAGRTLRDYDSFFSAMEQLPYPAAISRPNFDLLREHGARFRRSLEQLPENVRVIEDDGSDEALADLLRKAKIVVVPVLKESMAASGCSTCLNAMLFGKPVIGTEGPGFSDIFTQGEVLCVPPEDAAALRDAIRRLWEDNQIRNRTAAAGREYGLIAGGEQQLFQRVLEDVARFM